MQITFNAITFVLPKLMSNVSQLHGLHILFNKRISLFRFSYRLKEKSKGQDEQRENHFKVPLQIKIKKYTFFFSWATRFSSEPGVANDILENEPIFGQNLKLKAKQPSCLYKKMCSQQVKEKSLKYSLQDPDPFMESSKNDISQKYASMH